MANGKKKAASRSKSSVATAAAKRENARLARERRQSPTGETTSERVMREAAVQQFGVWIAPQLHIPTAAVLAVKALQQERKALEGKLELVKKDLKAQEPPIIAALEAGLPTEPGCPPCAVDVEERVTPGWKAEALVLAVALGKNVGVYEAEIRAKTAPTVIKKLIINGREGE